MCKAKSDAYTSHFKYKSAEEFITLYREKLKFRFRISFRSKLSSCLHQLFAQTLYNANGCRRKAQLEQSPKSFYRSGRRILTGLRRYANMVLIKRVNEHFAMKRKRELIRRILREDYKARKNVNPKKTTNSLAPL